MCPASCQTRQAVFSIPLSHALTQHAGIGVSHLQNESQAPPSFVLQGQARQAESMPHGGWEGLQGEAYGMGVGHKLVWSHGHRTRTRTRIAVESEDPNRQEATTPSTITW